MDLTENITQGTQHIKDGIIDFTAGSLGIYLVLVSLRYFIKFRNTYLF